MARLGGPSGPRARLAKARSWKRSKPKAWRRLVELAYQQRRECGAVSIKAAFEQMRLEERQEGRPGKYELDNNISAALGRMLAEEEPFLAPFIKKRESRIDSVIAFEEALPDAKQNDSV